MTTKANQHIADEICRMADEDQHARTEMARMSSALRAIDAANTATMRALIAQIGWPTRSKVGERAEHRAWLLVQHADADRDFQRSCLELMKRESADEVCRKHIAYLEDRLAVAEGRPQTYGTQLRQTAAGTFEPVAIEDASRVDERRAAVGLEPLSDYRRRQAPAADPNAPR